MFYDLAAEKPNGEKFIAEVGEFRPEPPKAKQGDTPIIVAELKPNEYVQQHMLAGISAVAKEILLADANH